MKITKAGIYRDFDVATYHSDPAPEPSLSQSLAKIINEFSPLHAKYAHPRLTPVSSDEEDGEKYVKAKAIGDAAHALMIGRGKELAIGCFDSWRTKDAQAFREKSEAAGKTAILEKHFKVAQDIQSAAQNQLDLHKENNCFKDGAGEVALIWNEGPIWFRCLVDWLHTDLRTIDDYKTTEMSVAPHVIGLRAADAGWDIQAAMIERGLDVLDDSHERKYRFIAQEQKAPNALNVMVMNEQWLTMGRKKLQHAIDIWVSCIVSGQWPGYPPFPITPEYPGWKEAQWLAREIHEAGEERKPFLTSLAGG